MPAVVEVAAHFVGCGSSVNREPWRASLVNGGCDLATFRGALAPMTKGKGSAEEESLGDPRGGERGGISSSGGPPHRTHPSR
jgi:hypothetical protein